MANNRNADKTNGMEILHRLFTEAKWKYRIQRTLNTSQEDIRLKAYQKAEKPMTACKDLSNMRRMLTVKDQLTCRIQSKM